MKILFFLIIFFEFIIVIGIGILPFILAKALSLPWINWFGIVTVPTAIMIIFVGLFMIENMNEE